MRMVASFIVAVACLGQTADDVAAARADYATYGTTARYVSLSPIPADERAGALLALNYWLPHLSREVVLEHQLPQRITDTVYRLDYDLLGWGRKGWLAISRDYPYFLTGDALIVRADWLLFETADASRSTLYYELLLGGVPKTKTEFAKAFGIDLTADPLAQRVVIDEGRSGVSLQTRLLEIRDEKSRTFSQTFDSLESSEDSDVPEVLAGGLDFDAQELIVSMPKIDLRTGARGAAQAYFLTDGNGNRVDIADGRIVVDHEQFLDVPQIRTPGSCVVCHATGLNAPAQNLVRDWISAGVELTVKQKGLQQQLEAFFLGDTGRIVTRNNEDFAAFVQGACGCDPLVAMNQWRSAVEAYDLPVTLEFAAYELSCTADELRTAIGIYSEAIGPQERVARLSSLAHDFPVPRAAWEGGVYFQAQAALSQLRASQ